MKKTKKTRPNFCEEYYFKLTDFSLLYSHYAYVDVPEYLADQLFVKHRVYVYFGKEFSDPENHYRIIMCKVAKWRRRAFEAALDELPGLMAMTGRSDYLEFAQKLVRDSIDKKGR